jgi:membrane associated rhomboid family serine protease
MLFPIRTDRRLTHTPYANYALVGANVLVFLATGAGTTFLDPEAAFMLMPSRPEWYQFFTYQFLHAGWQHLIMNMVFLWVFGNSLEDRLGPIGYLAFYLAGGVIAGVGHALLSTTPVLGASGAVCAVTGAYLALFPRSQVTLIWFFFFISEIEVSSLWLIGLFFGLDVFRQLSGAEGTAYLAHISGYIFGFGIGIGLLYIRLLPREPFDFLSLVDRWNRRRQARAAVSQGQSPWQADASKRIASSPAAEKPLTPEQAQRADQIRRLRQQVDQALGQQRDDQALGLYDQLMQVDPEHCLTRQRQLDVANYAMNAQRYTMAAHAYERFLASYEQDEYAGQVRLILALIYSRYLNNRQRAADLLRDAQDKLTDPQQQAMARDMLGELEGES